MNNYYFLTQLINLNYEENLSFLRSYRSCNEC